MLPKKNAPINWAEEFLQVKQQQPKPSSLTIEYKKQNHSSLLVETDLAGIYQVQNVRTVLTAVDALNQNGWKLNSEIVLAALKEVKNKTGLSGRWEVIHREPTIVLEVAHNQAGIVKMLEHLHQLQFNQLHIVIGMVKDKEVEKVLTMLPINAQYYFTQATIPRALAAGELKQKAESSTLTGEAYNNVNLALNAAKQKAQKDDLIIVCGSIFLVAEVDKSQYESSPNRSKA